MKLSGPEIITALVGLLTALATYFQGRKHGQGVFIKAVQEAAHIVINDLRKECDRLKGQHAQCEQKLETMQAQINALMATTPVAVYDLDGPKGAVMDDATLLALCIWSEAAREIPAGRQAVAQVVMNRMRDHYESDGTVTGTVLCPNQFSGFWFDFVGGKYTRVCWTREDAEHRAQAMLLRAQRQAVWDQCIGLAEGVLDGSDPPAKTLDKALLYLNPEIIPKLPAWASPDKALCAIGHHTFYEA